MNTPTQPQTKAHWNGLTVEGSLVPSYRLDLANDSFQSSVQLSELLGTVPLECKAFISLRSTLTHPDERDLRWRAWEEFLSQPDRTESFFQYRIQNRENCWVPVGEYCRKTVSPDGHVREISGVFFFSDWKNDDGKKTEKIFELQSETLAAIARGDSTTATLTDLILLTEKNLPGLRVSYLYANQEETLLQSMIAPSLPADYLQLAHQGIPIGDGQGSCGTAAFRREPVIVSEIESDPLWNKYRSFAAEAGLRSCWSSPVFSSRGELYGTFAIYSSTSRSPTRHELRILSTICRLGGIAIERGRLDAGRSEMLRTFLGTAIAWVRLNLNLIITSCNPAATQLLGMTSETLVGLAFPDLFEEESCREEIHEFLTGIAQGAAPETRETLLTRQGYAPLNLALDTVAVSDRKQSVSGITIVLKDVTRSKSLEAQLRHAQKMEAIGTLAGGIAHDFNNLLLVVNLSLNGLEQQTSLDPSARSLLDEALLAVDQATLLTRQLLTFSRRQITVKHPLILDDLIKEHLPILRRSLRDDILLEIKLEGAGGVILADAGQICQVLINLSVNARDAMPMGGVLTISTELVPPDKTSVVQGEESLLSSTLILRVADNGIGMDETTQSRLFEPFYTTKGLNGTGLGLSVVHGIVSDIGGTIRVRSQPGKGSVFEIQIPAHRGEIPEKVTKTAIEPRSQTDQILVIEDNESVQRLIVETLSRHGYRVITASHGLEAIHLPEAELQKTRVIVSDIVMPYMNGIDAYKHLKKQFPHLKILFVSGNTDKMQSELTSFNNEVCFLQKPFRPDELIHLVRDLLENSTSGVK